jgi:hypothetical protein
MRLFACTALVRLAPKCPEPFEGECETLARLISSAIELGQPVARAAAGLLALRFLAYPGHGEDRPFLAFAILLLAALEGGEDRGQWLVGLTDQREADGVPWRSEFWLDPNLRIRLAQPKLCSYWANWSPRSDTSNTR